MNDHVGPLTRLYRDRSGVAAIEFAVIAPVMLLMLFATFELFNAARVQSKLNLAAGQLAQMIAAQTSVTEGSNHGAGGSLGDLCTAVSYNMLPYNPSRLSAWIGSTTVDSNGVLQQDWVNDLSCPSSETSGSPKEITVLTGISNTPLSMYTQNGSQQSAQNGKPGYSAITVQLTYYYANILPYLLGTTLTYKAVGSARPRSNTTIPCTYPDTASTTKCLGAY